MIQKFEVSGVHTTIDPALRKYVNRKIGSLDKYVPKHNRPSAHCEVHLKEAKAKNNNTCECDVTLYLPHQTIVIKESSINMYAAIDIAEAKLKMQLKKYKDLHASGRLHRHLAARFRRKRI
jgi:ribosomal subunit interface protein